MPWYEPGKYNIDLAIDQHEAEGFAEWLRGQGHIVRHGFVKRTIVDEVCNAGTNRLMRKLWQDYCRANRAFRQNN